MRKIYILGLLIFASLVFASGNGSIYSKFGIGEYKNSINARTFTLGGVGTALFDRFAINTVNPAANSYLVLPRLETSFNYNGYGIENKGQNAFYSNGLFNGIVVGIPVERQYGISLTGGFIPVSNTDYVFKDKEFINEKKFEYEEVGSVTKAYAGITYRLPFDISLGANLEYYVGNRDYMSRVYNEDASVKNAEFKTNRHFVGVSTTLGLMSGNLVGNSDWQGLRDFRIGFSYSPEREFDCDTIVTLRSFSGDNIGSNSEQSKEMFDGKTKVKIPGIMNVGAYAKIKDFSFNADFRYVSTSKYEYNNEKTNLNDSYSVTFGAEYSADKPRSYWGAVPLRVGFGYEKTPYIVNGKDVLAYSLMAGFGLPLSKESAIDLGFQYTNRGSGTDMKENIYRLNVSIGFSEIWFVREER